MNRMFGSCQDIAIALLIATQVLNPPLLYAGSEPKNYVRHKVLVQPVLDGDMDEETGEIALSIHHFLADQDDFELLTEEQIKELAKYHKKSFASAEGISESEKKLTQAKEYYLKADFKKSSKYAGQLITELEQREDWRDNGAILLEAHLTKALCSWAFRNRPLVVESFNKLLYIDPNHKLDNSLFAPGFVRLFEETKKEFLNKPLGRVRFDTSPAGAEVYLNGIKQCITPCESFLLPVGNYLVAVKTNKYKEIEETVQIKPDITIEYTKKLQWSDDAPLDKKQNSESQTAKILEEIKYSSELGGTLKLDKIILVNATSISKDKATVFIRVVDSQSKSGQSPLSFQFFRHKIIPIRKLKGISTALLEQMHQDIASNPSRYSDPKGFGDATLLGKRHKKLTKQPLFWIGIGAAVLTGVLLGIFATGGGGEGPPPSEDTKIKLKIE